MLSLYIKKPLMRILRFAQLTGGIMYAKFPFYSVAQMYALTLNTPVVIMLGGDHLYWVVDQSNELKFVQQGCSLLSYAV